MLLYKKILPIIILSSLFASNERTVLKPGNLNHKTDPVVIWQEEDNEISNNELKKQLAKLREEFRLERKTIQKEFQVKIEPLKHQRDNDLSILKKDFTSRRDALKKKYGVSKKPKKVKKDKNKSYLNKPVNVKKDNKHKTIKEAESTKSPQKKSIDNNDKSSIKK